MVFLQKMLDFEKPSFSGLIFHCKEWFLKNLAYLEKNLVYLMSLALVQKNLVFLEAIVFRKTKLFTDILGLSATWPHVSDKPGFSPEKLGLSD